jgi:hypothetical protein
VLRGPGLPGAAGSGWDRGTPADGSARMPQNVFRTRGSGFFSLDLSPVAGPVTGM